MGIRIYIYIYIHIYIYIYIYIQETLLILKKFIFLLHIYQHITAYSSAIKFTRLIPWNISVQDKGMVKPMYTLALI